MSNGDWLPIIRREYLQDFVRIGGAAVKFVIPEESREHQKLWQDLERAAEEDGYVFAAVDAANTKVHMVDKLFNEVARQIGWDDLAHAFLCSTLLDSSYLVPAEREELSLSRIAYLNGLDLAEMRAIINSRLRERLSQDYAMTHAPPHLAPHRQENPRLL